MFLPGLVAGRLFDLGYFKVVQFCASLVLVSATVLIGECHAYWQLLLCQGVAIGVRPCRPPNSFLSDILPHQLSCGCIFGPTLSCVSQWFGSRRATALGMVAVGSSIGGTLLPLTFRTLIARTRSFPGSGYLAVGGVR
jgi:MFS transporter, MCT family, solute carrier family 16 (monocarboxylic acid transporters), member 10